MDGSKLSNYNIKKASSCDKITMRLSRYATSNHNIQPINLESKLTP